MDLKHETVIEVSNGDIIKFIDFKLDARHAEIREKERGKRYLRIYETDINVPSALRHLSSVRSITVHEDVCIEDDCVICRISSPEKLKPYLDFNETYIVKMRGRNLICEFSSQGRVHQIAALFKSMIWNLYKKRRTDKLNDDLRCVITSPSSWGYDDDDILQ
jgi:hypothetical protein